MVSMTTVDPIQTITEGMSFYWIYYNMTIILYYSFRFRMSSVIPVIHNLLSDHLDILKALHTADVIDQNVGVSAADSSTPRIQPLLMETNKQTKTLNQTDDD